MTLERKRDLRALAVLFAASAVLLLIFSECSPLYALNTWVDPNCFMTVGRGMRAGLVPYRDLMEQKGPLLYVIHLVAALISPSSFHGVYPIEVLVHTVFLFASWKTARLFAKRGVLPVLVAAFLVMINSYAYGDTAEMLCLPMLAWSLYDAVCYFKDDERRMSDGAFLRNGFLAGCVLWIKFSLLGLHFAWMAVITIECVARERKIGRAARMCLIFLGGMALSALPWLVYFGLNGAIGDLIDVYFVQNITGYPNNEGFIYNLIHGFGNDAFYNFLLATMVFAGFIYLLLGVKKHLWLKICLVAMAACTAVLLYMGGRFRGYTFHVYGAFLPLFAAAVCGLCDRAEGRQRTLAAVLASLVLLGMCGYELYDAQDELALIGVPEEDYIQYAFAEEINKTENPSLLNFGFLDGGFYLAAEVVPTERWFCKLNVNQEECFAAQSSAVEEGRVDYVVTNGKTLEELGVNVDGYDLAAQGWTYYLYKRQGIL